MNTPVREPDPRRQQSREISLRLSLLDAQVVDVDDLPVGRVDDLELESTDHGVHVTALLIGQRYVGSRIGGITGGFLTRLAHRLSDDDEDGRIGADLVQSWSGMCKLRRPLADLPAAGLERWLSSRVVRHIPGADDEGL
jgi:hypothetical protein